MRNHLGVSRDTETPSVHKALLASTVGRSGLPLIQSLRNGQNVSQFESHFSLLLAVEPSRPM